MEKLKNMWRRVVVVLKAAPTWMLMISTVITVASPQIVDLLPDSLNAVVTKYTTIIVGMLGSAIILIRRLTPVLPNERGILPVDSSA